jgi:hypothetical protein
LNNDNNKNNQDIDGKNDAAQRDDNDDATFESVEQDAQTAEASTLNNAQNNQNHAISTNVISKTKQKINTVRNKFKAWHLRFRERLSLLHPNQVIYLIALAIYLLSDGNLDEENFDLWLVGLLAFFGMARELWSIFIKVWESTLGRLILIVLYAALANYTLAMASQKVNEVIGADPTYLYHTQGLVTFLLLPLWVLSVSVAAMALTFGFLQVFRLFGGVLVFLRLRRKRKNTKEVFPKTFIIIRLILVVPVVLTLSYSLSWYGEQLNLEATPGVHIYKTADNETQTAIKDLSLTIIDERLSETDVDEQEREELLSARAEIIAATNNQEKNTESATNDSQSPELEKTEADAPTQAKFLEKLIAAFVYNYEAFQYSHCAKADNERVVYISEEHILAVSKDESASIGYIFSTRDCISKSNGQNTQ